tara:strand:+ start:153 stop:779 length:627 start_codon:yes stop_codon:yes gene_type:complete
MEAPIQKILLIEHIPFTISPQMLKESITKNNGILLVKGVIQRAGSLNHNGRVYPKSVLAKEVEKYIEGPILERRAYGELDHSTDSIINLKNTCLNIQKLWWEGNDLMGLIEILPTPSGNIAKALIQSGCTLGISSRALGSVRQLGENTVEVQDDLELICWDFVSTPSTHGAFVTPINEGVTRLPYQKYEKVNSVLKDIICFNTNVCSL